VSNFWFVGVDVVHGFACVYHFLMRAIDVSNFCFCVCLFVCLMVFNVTFNNILVISGRSVLLVEDSEKTNDLSQVTDMLYHIMLHTSPWSRFELTSVVIGTDCRSWCCSHSLIRMSSFCELLRIYSLYITTDVLK
jgi:hypothetical protein